MGTSDAFVVGIDHIRKKGAEFNTQRLALGCECWIIRAGVNRLYLDSDVDRQIATYERERFRE